MLRECVMLLLLLLSLSSLFTRSSTCYIQNCPRGGKRDQPDTIRQCMACGPGNKGRCFGPSICCGAGLGCVVGSPDTLSCLEENFLPGPCETGGASCGAEGGRCGAPGVCCHTGSCVLDSQCSDVVVSHSSSDSGELKGVSGEVLWHLLKLASRRSSAF